MRRTLRDNIAQGDANYLSVLDEADAYVARNGLDLPEEPEARKIGPDPDCMTDPICELTLPAAGVASIVWATGFALDFGWLKVDAFDEGRPEAPARRFGRARNLFPGTALAIAAGVPFIWGVWHDAEYLADHIATQRGYLVHETNYPRKELP